MPEAAEVELVKRGLEEAFGLASSMTRIDLLDSNFKPSSIEKLTLPEKILSVRRQGKLIGIDLESATLAIHLRLSGRVVVGFDEKSRANFHFKNEKGMGVVSFADPRRFATLDLVESEDFGKNLGIDLLSGNIDTWQPPLKSTRAVKAVMLDQTEIAGIGNYLIDEALWEAKINPKTPFMKLSEAEAKDIAYKARSVAQKALGYGGVSVRDYVSVKGEMGSFQESLKAYGRAGRPCRRCGRDLEKTTVGGRGTVFCSFCQS